MPFCSSKHTIALCEAPESNLHLRHWRLGDELQSSGGGDKSVLVRKALGYARKRRKDGGCNEKRRNLVGVVLRGGEFGRG